MKLRELVKEFAPPILSRSYRRVRKSVRSFIGPFSSWQEAQSHSSGYDSDAIVEKVKNALLKVRHGEASCERDSVLFATKQYSFPVLVGLLRAALDSGGQLAVLDFGGSLGSSYFLYRDFLGSASAIRWHVIEQPKFVECAKRYFENEELRFFTRLEDSVHEASPNIALFSSVLQYLERPHEVLEAMLRVAPHYIIVDRTPIREEKADLLTVQIVPPEIYAASYPSWIFGASALQDRLSKRYRLLLDWDSSDGMIRDGDIVARYRGLMFERIDCS